MQQYHAQDQGVMQWKVERGTPEEREKMKESEDPRLKTKPLIYPADPQLFSHIIRDTER